MWAGTVDHLSGWAGIVDHLSGWAGTVDHLSVWSGTVDQLHHQNYLGLVPKIHSKLQYTWATSLIIPTKDTPWGSRLD